MSRNSIAWVVPHDGYDDEPLLVPLREQGLQPVVCTPGSSATLDVEARVLQADLFADSRLLRREYVRDDRPTLVIVSSAEQEADALEFLKPRDDVVRGTRPAELLVLRLARLLKQAGGEAMLRTLESTDELTGLGNRRRWEKQLTQALGPAAGGEARAVVLFDLDHFKQINDRYGHQAGDHVLREVAGLLRAESAPSDRLCRIGGEEFGVLLARYDADTASADVQRMLRRIAEHRFLLPAAGIAPGATTWAAGGVLALPEAGESGFAELQSEETLRIPVTASAGMAFIGPHATYSSLLRAADMALYEAKGRGRNRLVLYESLQEDSVQEDRDLYLRHFENVTRVMTERVTAMVTNMGRSLVEAARREANQDALTLLHNRRYFDARLGRELETARRHGRALSIALIDLDHFHDVNATHGYPTGDHVLRRFAEIARGSVRLTDWLARYGGEEFVLVMPDTDLETAQRVAERVRRNVAAAPIPGLDQRPVPLTVSAGVAQLDLRDDTALSLVQKASDAVLFAKRQGRNRLVVAG